MFGAAFLSGDGCLGDPWWEVRGRGASWVLWGGARRALTTTGSLDEVLIPFVLQGAANSRWSQDLLVRQEKPWGDDLNVCVYRNV